MSGWLRFFWRGVTIRRGAYQDGDLRVLVEDTHYLGGDEESFRGLRVDALDVTYSRIPLKRGSGALLVYGYCAPLIAMAAAQAGGLNRALVLGGGGGAVPLYMLRNYDEAQVDIVEYSAGAVDACARFFLPDYVGEGGRARLIQADAREAVHDLDGSYTFLFCDLYVADEPAEITYDAAFAKEMSRLVADEGLLVVNGGGLTMDGVRGVLKNLLAAFDQAWAMMLEEGIVLVAANRPMPMIDRLMAGGSGIVPLYPSVLREEELRPTPPSE